jgi:hypothetical protein
MHLKYLFNSPNCEELWSAPQLCEVFIMIHNNEISSILLGKLVGCMILAFTLYLQHDV